MYVYLKLATMVDRGGDVGDFMHLLITDLVSLETSLLHAKGESGNLLISN